MAKTKRQPDSPLAATRSRIRDAEKRLAPITREMVGLDEESYATVAELVERGLGRKTEVMRQALATGLRVMKAGSDAPATAPTGTWEYETAYEAPTGARFLAPPTIPHNPLVAASLGLTAEMGPAIEAPPSVEREAEDEVEE